MYIPKTQKIIDFGNQQNLCVCVGGHNQKIKNEKIEIFDSIISLENLFAAWKNFLRGKRARFETQAFSMRLESNLLELRKVLEQETWQHGCYKQLIVCDPKPRKIHKADIRDRIIHHALVRVIEPIFDRSFIFDSWSCRLGKGNRAAVLRCNDLLRKLSRNNRRPVWILKCDIKKYFESIDQQILMNEIKKKITDQDALNIITKIVKSFSPGLPLGNLTSQLFANIYLNPFDHFIKEKLFAPLYMRYCDDFILAHQSKEWLLAKVDNIKDFLYSKLRLTLHPNKILLRPWHHGIDWLGVVIYPSHLKLRPNTYKRIWINVCRTTQEYLVNNLSRDSFRSTIMSYIGLLQSAGHNRDCEKLFELLKFL